MGDKAPRATLFLDRARPAHILFAGAMLKLARPCPPVPRAHPNGWGDLREGRARRPWVPRCANPIAVAGSSWSRPLRVTLGAPGEAHQVVGMQGCFSGLGVCSDYLQIGSLTNLLPAHLWEWSVAQTHLSSL